MHINSSRSYWNRQVVRQELELLVDVLLQNGRRDKASESVLLAFQAQRVTHQIHDFDVDEGVGVDAEICRSHWDRRTTTDSGTAREELKLGRHDSHFVLSGFYEY